MPAADAYGFIGLGRMGGPMAANLAKAGFGPSAFDKAGTEDRAPPGSLTAESVAEIAGTCDAIFLSLPAGPDVLAVLAEIVAVRNGVQVTQKKPPLVVQDADGTACAS